MAITSTSIMSTPGKDLYMRLHSTNIRKWTYGEETMVEDPIVLVKGLKLCVIRIICRNRARILQQAWQRWCTNTSIHHNYAFDMRVILSRPLDRTVRRSELEIEIGYKWVINNCNVDPTGIAYMIQACRSRRLRIDSFNHMRLETYDSGDMIICQGNLPRLDDGHFTVLSGTVDVMQFPPGSVKLLLVQELAKSRQWTDYVRVQSQAQKMAVLHSPSGFGVCPPCPGPHAALV